MTQATTSTRNTTSMPETVCNERSSSAENLVPANGNAANGNIANGNVANGNAPVAFAPPDVRPDVQQTVVAAAQIAEQRQMPLRAGAMRMEASKNGVALNGNGASTNGHAGSNGAHNGAIEYSISVQNERERPSIAATIETIAPQMQQVEAEIARLITSPVKLVADIASHTLGAGGKRLRPALTIFAAQIVNPEIDVRTLTCAAVVELTHTTALIHDDVVDNAQTRRGKPAANLVWGNETSVLVGDYLCAQAFITVAKPEFRDVLPHLAQATAELCAGELLETQTRGLLSMSEAQYFDIVALKTASLTGCACRVGAITGGATGEQEERLARYGRDLGLAFQIVDDVFDVIASQSRLGKPVGNDIREGDITLPMLRAMQVCTDRDREDLCAIIGKDPISDEEVARAVTILRGCDAVEYSMAMARGFVLSAKSQLDIFADSAARQALLDVADYVLSRDN
jgi:geranylgeranyl pyrophosphate synthase